MFDKILIANRGEIACRVIRTARRLGIRTVAVYSDADAGARHVAMADEAYAIGASPARESYLSIPSIIAAATRTGAAAIHPGYGFLSENADFAAACEAAGIVFIGPSAATIRIMGSKAEAKTLMAKVNLPLVPGYHGADQSDERFAAAARAIGFPVLLKASAGGGGMGMRVVAHEAGLAPALASARREAAGAFGDDRMLLEKYLTRPRHIEVQVFADRHGNCIHLFERDCSIQRRHQKVIEEAPAPHLSDKRRESLGSLAVAAARAANYVGAGTVEFVAEGDDFFFIEMNTRLQVEHVVTEMVTGLDLVEWQLRVAAGEPLALDQAAVQTHGHAIEARLYAEDPARDFRPGAGRLALFRLPMESSDLRVETGFRQGDTIPPFYDAMVAKLIAWGENRHQAVERLKAALAALRVAGLASNRDFLLRVVAHPEFSEGRQDTGFIERYRDDLLPAATVSMRALLAAVYALLLDQRVVAPSRDPHSPWRLRDGWRLTEKASRSFRLHGASKDHDLHVRDAGDHYICEIDETSYRLSGRPVALGELEIGLDGEHFDAALHREGAEIWVVLADGTYRLDYRDPLAVTRLGVTGAGRLTAPLPGKVSAVLISPGATVKRGQTLMLLEAMKMEHAIVAPADGKVERVNYGPGDLVEEGRELIVFAAEIARTDTGKAET